MLKQLKNYKLGKKQQGFTIIEVMIVLAIAALILVIVFLAVPALQRSSRNTQRNTDASNLLTAYSNYVTNNGGSGPTAACDGTDPCEFFSNAKLGYYDDTTKNVAYMTKFISGFTGPDGDNASKQLYIIAGAKCKDAQTAEASNQPRQYVAWYGLEGSPATKCVEG